MQVRYSGVDDVPASFMPRLPLKLSYGNRSVEVVGLLDTGSAVNALPYEIGVELGAEWTQQSVPVKLVGSLGDYEARALVVMASHPDITGEQMVRLVFAWTKAPHAPVIFGQMNFFLEFDVCFYRSQAVFEIVRRGSIP